MKDEVFHSQKFQKGTKICNQYHLYMLPYFVSHKRLSLSHKKFLTNLNTIIILRALFETLNSKEWKQVMRAEMDALEKNRVLDMVELPRGKSLVRCKWVFIVKHKVGGFLESYKARLIATSYTRTYGVDYHETFALMMKRTLKELYSLWLPNLIRNYNNLM